MKNVVCFFVRFCLWCSATSSSPYTKTFRVSQFIKPPKFQDTYHLLTCLFVINRQDQRITEYSWLYIIIYIRVCIFNADAINIFRWVKLSDQVCSLQTRQILSSWLTKQNKNTRYDLCTRRLCPITITTVQLDSILFISF